MSISDNEQFQSFYATHKSMIYGIVDEIAQSGEERDQLFTSTFVEAFRLNLPAQKYPNPCISLSRLVLRFAFDSIGQFNGQMELGKLAFSASPFLKKLVMIEMENFSILDSKAFARTQAHRDLRDDFILFRNTRTSKAAVSNSELAKPMISISR